MSQALMNEVKSLKARVEALERHLTALESNIQTHYQRKRGPRPDGATSSDRAGAAVMTGAG